MAAIDSSLGKPLEALPRKVGLLYTVVFPELLRSQVPDTFLVGQQDEFVIFHAHSQRWHSRINGQIESPAILLTKTRLVLHWVSLG